MIELGLVAPGLETAAATPLVGSWENTDRRGGHYLSPRGVKAGQAFGPALGAKGVGNGTEPGLALVARCFVRGPA